MDGNLQEENILLILKIVKRLEVWKEFFCRHFLSCLCIYLHFHLKERKHVWDLNVDGRANIKIKYNVKE
jgi:hypothetical protein